MKLIVLTENIAGGHFLAEHGLSYLIEHEGKKLLFDTGHSDVFLKNAQKLGIVLLKETDTVVLSHGHWDHGDGLKYINNKTLICHPGVFMKRYRKTDRSYIGLSLNKDQLAEKFNLVLSEKPYRISEKIIFLGEIPRLLDFEAQTTSFIDDANEPDFVPDDSALAIIHQDELIVVTGCSHSGICNIIEYAKKISGITKVKAVIGGFHLKYDNRQTRETIRYLKKQGIEKVYPSHCTELPALTLFSQAFDIQFVKTGMVFLFQ